MAGTRPKASSLWRRINAPMVAAVVATALCGAMYFLHVTGSWDIPGLSGWEERSIDLRFQLRGERKPADDRIVIVALDDRTRRERPDVWQSRRGYAQLIRAIASAKPRAFGIDAFFSSPEVNLSRSTVEAVRSARNALAAQTELGEVAAEAARALERVDEETRGDEALADAVADSDSLVLALLFYLGGTPIAPGTPERAGMQGARVDESVFLEQPPHARPPQADGVLAPLSVVGANVRAMGHVNVRHAKDGLVREAPLVIEAGGRFYQSLALKMASMELGLPTSYASGDRSLELGATQHPIDQQTYARIGYLGGNHTFPRVSAAEVLERDGPHPALQGRVVLLGYTDAARDKLITPLDRQLDGVEMHANLIHNLVHGGLLRTGSQRTTLLVLLAFGLLLALAQLRAVRSRASWLGGALALGVGLLYCALAQIVFERSDLVLDLVAPLLTLLLVTLASLITALATEGREKAQLRAAFGQYLQATVVERLIRNPERLRLGGQRRELTVLFSDIRGFSKFSETLPPEVLGNFLNEYLTPMTELVMADSGMLDKYIGDAVMAVYGAPVSQDDHASKACATALAMQEALVPLNEIWGARGLPEIRIGIGINSGPMSVGNMGSERRFDYTVMGDAVNLGARLEGLTKAYDVGILVGEATAKAAAQDYAFREVDRVRVIGRQAAAPVFELCGPQSDEVSKLCASYASALALYRAQAWDEAESAFEQHLSEFPGDGPALALRERIPSLRTANLGPAWDGAYEQRSK